MTQDAQSGSSSTSQTAKEQAAGVAQGAAESGHRLVDQAKEQAGGVGREAGRQAKDVLSQGRTELSDQAAAQQRKVAGGLRSFGQELGSMARSSEQPGLATDVAHQVATRADSAAAWLDDREPGALLEEVKSFARNRPGTFLAVALTAGVLAGRLTRGLKDAAADQDQAGSGDASGAAHRAPGAPLTGAAGPIRGAGIGAGSIAGGLGSGSAAGLGTVDDVGGVPQRTSAYGPGPTDASGGTGAGVPTTHGSVEDTTVYGSAGPSGAYVDPSDLSQPLIPEQDRGAHPSPGEGEPR